MPILGDSEKVKNSGYTNYFGTIAENSTADYYKFTLSSSGRLKLDATAMMYRIRYKIYDSEGNELWSNLCYWNNVTQKSVGSKSLDLTKGTYYFVVEKYYDTGNYSFNIKHHTHTYKEKITKATLTKDGKIEKKCTWGAVFSSKTIYYPSNIKLSATEFVYNGKVRKPTIKVTSSDGKVIKALNY